MRRQVALIIETSSMYGREVLSGIVQYMRMHDQWSVFLEERDLWHEPPSWLATWNGDGIISRSTTPELLDAVSRTKVPLIDMTDRRDDEGEFHIRSNDVEIGRLGAEHLIEKGFSRFAFCGFVSEAWSLRRREAFIPVVEAHSSQPCAIYESLWQGEDALTWDGEQQKLSEWLSTLETPFAVMACNDVRAQQVADACATLELAVPEQVAILGVDNDTLRCRMCAPPLSSIVPNAEAVGFRAAEMLATLMDGRQPEQPIQLISPRRIAVRQSTDIVAVENPALAAALRYIREHACRGLTVDEVVLNNPISRSTLERQSRKYLGRSPQGEIRHVQIKRASELLLSTELSAEQISALCGFEHPEYMHVVFKRITGLTTRQYRRQKQVGVLESESRV